MSTVESRSGIAHWSGGSIFAGASGRSAEVTNPATGVMSGEVALASVEDARVVVDAAAAAFPDFSELLNVRKAELAAITTAEHGKVLSEALGDGQDVVEFDCCIPYLPAGVLNVLQGDTMAVDELLTNKKVKSFSFVRSTPIAEYV